LTLMRLRPTAAGPLSTVADEIERHLHGGNLAAIEGHAPVPDIRFRDGKVDVGIDQASSSVVELAALTLWLRHFLAPGDLVVIEEPEAHLHPAKQLILAECLARLVRCGLRVVITTHSDLLLRKLGSVVMATELADRDRPGSEPGIWQIRRDELAVYRFGAHPQGGFVANRESISLGYGIETEELSAVEEALYDERTVLRQRLGNLGTAED